MIVSSITYYILFGLVILLFSLPLYYFGFRRKTNQKKAANWVWLPILVVPFNWIMPSVITVSDCTTYTKEVLIFPSGKYALGFHLYIKNHSSSDLFLESIVFGKAQRKIKDILIKPYETKKCEITKINYILESPPATVIVDEKGEIHYMLSCVESDN